MEALQDIYGPNGICFGCGPKNDKGLRIKTFFDDENNVYYVKYHPRKEHQAFEGVVNGGIIGSIFDCHGNWAAAHALYLLNQSEPFPVTVTANFTVNLKKPTPFNVELITTAKIEKIEGSKVFVSGEMKANDLTTATFSGLFIGVKKDHPAYHRWD